MRDFMKRSMEIVTTMKARRCILLLLVVGLALPLNQVMALEVGEIGSGGTVFAGSANDNNDSSNTAIGFNSTASGFYDTASGAYSTATGSYSTASGAYSKATGSYSTASGAYSTASGYQSTASGVLSTATGSNSTALGNYSLVEIGATNSVALGAGSIASQYNTVSLGNSTLQRRIVNMADGVDPSDAATVGQVATEAAARTIADTNLQNNINTNTTDIIDIQEHNRGLSWTANGVPVGASATGIGSTAVGDGASARTRDTAIGYMATVTADGSTAIGANTLIATANSVAIGADATVNAVGGTALGQNASVAVGATGSVAIGQNSEATEANTVSVGSASNQRRITNVADGVNANDAVTVQQLQQFTTSSNADIGRLDNSIDDLDDRMDKLGALSMAIAQLSPNPRAQGDTSLSLGIGHYSGSSALAAGLFHHVNDNIMFKASITSTSGETGGGGGMTISW